MMTAQANERLGHLFAEIVNGRDLERFDEFVAPDYVNHNPYAEPGLNGVKKVFGTILHGLPDLRVTAEDVFASSDGSKVVGRYRYEGTHLGNLMGYPPTGAPVSMRSIDIWRVEDGRFVEHWDELNMLETFTQIGAVQMRPPQAA
jgi:predicted ester cyclase